MPKSKIQNKSQCQISPAQAGSRLVLNEWRENIKTKILLFVICALIFICHLCFGICHLYAQDSSKLVALTKQIIEAKNNEDAYLALEELADLYFSRPPIKSEGGIPLEAGKENKYSEFVDFLKSLQQKNKTLEPLIDYHIALTRYYQLKYLEESQKWDEYFSQGNTYRDELTKCAQKTVEVTTTKDLLHIDARLLLWQFHQDQQDNLSGEALSNLMQAVLEYSQDATDVSILKDVAGRLLSYGYRAQAKELHKVYVNKLITSSQIKEEDLADIAFDLWKAGDVELSKAIYDAYIERVEKTLPKEKLTAILVGIAKIFSSLPLYSSHLELDYAEKIFKKLEQLAGKEVFDEELMYLRAFNLEKAKDYSKAKDYYTELVERNPKSGYTNEAVYKIGIIYTYILRDIEKGKDYFQRLAQRQEELSPQVISGLYQLGLINQWQGDLIPAKDYYAKLIDLAKDKYPETTVLARYRLAEIVQAKPMEYNLRIFLDVCLKDEYAMLDMANLSLSASSFMSKKDKGIKINSLTYTESTGCLQVELQCLWSGHLGQAMPSLNETSFDTIYNQTGTKEINVVVVSPTGIIARDILLVDVH